MGIICCVTLWARQMTDYLTQHEQHSLQVHRMGTGILDDFVFPSLVDTYKQSRLAVLDFGDLLTLRQSAQLEKIVTEIVQKSQGSGWDKTNAELDDFAEYESTYYAGLLGAMFGLALVPPARNTTLKQIYDTMLNLEQGNRDFTGTIKQYQQVNTDSIARLYANAIRKGYHDNLTPNQIVTAIRNATNTTARHQSETVLRTVLQHFAIQSRAALAKKNSKHIKGFRYTAVLDSRTTVLCAGRDGNFYKVGEKMPSLPAHPNCRSEYLFVMKGEEIKGRRPAEGGKGTAEKPERTKASANGNTVYHEWLARQSRWFVEETLGKSRAKLFLDGGMEIKTFTDLAGNKLTLSQLKELDAKAFKRAGI